MNFEKFNKTRPLHADYQFLIQKPNLRQRSGYGGTVPLTELVENFFHDILKSLETYQKDGSTELVGGFLEGIMEIMREAFFSRPNVRVEENKESSGLLSELKKYKEGTNEYKTILQQLTVSELGRVLVTYQTGTPEYQAVFAQLTVTRNNLSKRTEIKYGVLSRVQQARNEVKYQKLLADLRIVYGAVAAIEESERQKITANAVAELTTKHIYPLSEAVSAYRGFIESQRVAKKIRELDASIGGFKSLLSQLKEGIAVLMIAAKGKQLSDIESIAADVDEKSYDETISKFISGDNKATGGELTSACQAVEIQPPALRKVLGKALGYVKWLETQIASKVEPCEELRRAQELYGIASQKFSASGISILQAGTAFSGNAIIKQNQDRLDTTKTGRIQVKSYITYETKQEQAGQETTSFDLVLDSTMILLELQNRANLLKTSFSKLEGGIAEIETTVAEFHHRRDQVLANTSSSSNTQSTLRRATTRPLDAKELITGKAAKIFFFGDELYKLLAQPCRATAMGEGNIERHVKTEAGKAWETYKQQKGYAQLSDYVALGKLLAEDAADNVKEESLFDIYKLRFFILEELSSCFFGANARIAKLHEPVSDFNYCWLISARGIPTEDQLTKSRTAVVGMIDEGDPEHQFPFIRPVMSLMFVYVDYVVKVKAIITKMQGNARFQSIEEKDVGGIKQALNAEFQGILQAMALLDCCITTLTSLLAAVPDKSESVEAFIKMMSIVQKKIKKLPDFLNDAPAFWSPDPAAVTAFQGLKASWVSLCQTSRADLLELFKYSPKVLQGGVVPPVLESKTSSTSTQTRDQSVSTSSPVLPLTNTGGSISSSTSSILNSSPFELTRPTSTQTQSAVSSSHTSSSSHAQAVERQPSLNMPIGTGSTQGTQSISVSSSNSTQSSAPIAPPLPVMSSSSNSISTSSESHTQPAVERRSSLKATESLPVSSSASTQSQLVNVGSEKSTSQGSASINSGSALQSSSSDSNTSSSSHTQSVPSDVPIAPSLPLVTPASSSAEVSSNSSSTLSSSQTPPVVDRRPSIPQAPDLSSTVPPPPPLPNMTASDFTKKSNPQPTSEPASQPEAVAKASDSEHGSGRSSGGGVDPMAEMKAKLAARKTKEQQASQQASPVPKPEPKEKQGSSKPAVTHDQPFSNEVAARVQAAMEAKSEVAPKPNKPKLEGQEDWSDTEAEGNASDQENDERQRDPKTALKNKLSPGDSSNAAGGRDGSPKNVLSEAAKAGITMTGSATTSEPSPSLTSDVSTSSSSSTTLSS